MNNDTKTRQSNPIARHRKDRRLNPKTGKPEVERYEIVVSLLTSQNRKIFRQSVYGKTIAAVRDKASLKAEELRTKYEAGTLKTHRPLTVAAFAEEWLRIKTPTLKPTSLAYYNYLLDRHILPTFGTCQLTALTTLKVDLWTSELINAGVSPTTVRQARDQLKRMYTAALKYKYVSENPVADSHRPGRADTKREVLTPEESRRFLRRARHHYLYALFYLAMVTGMRRGELLGLRWQDVDEAKLEVRIRQTVVDAGGRALMQSTAKSDRSRREIPISPTCLRVLQRHREMQRLEKQAFRERYRDQDLVFSGIKGQTLAFTVLSREFKQLINSVVVEEEKPVRFHDLRHTYASLSIRKGVKPSVLSRRLGHATVAFTMDTYAHLFEDMTREAALSADELLS